MLRYYAWALGEKALSLAPGGRSVYQKVGRLVKRKSQGVGGKFITSLPVVRKVQELAPPSATIVDIGTGWFHKDAFLLYLAGKGNYKIYLFDIEDKALLAYIKNYLGDLLCYTPLLAKQLNIDEAEIRERLEELLTLRSRSSIYERCNFEPVITDRVMDLFLPERSVDCMVSNCVLVHIPPKFLVQELRNLARILSEDGFMYHMLGHDDHWAFHDPSMAWPSFNYLKYSERTWRLVFTTDLEYQNRIVKPEWLDIFAKSGLSVVEYNQYVTDESRKAVANVSSIDKRFLRYDPEDLAIIYSYVLLRRQDGTRGTDSEGASKTGTVTLPTLE